MKTDRELLELAAKAAGIEGEWDGEGLMVGDDDDIAPTYWQPITDDGDALRLAVKLDLDHHFGEHGVFVVERCKTHPVWVSFDSFGGDRCAATRRAIVLAAAEVGKGLLTQDEFIRMFPGRFPDAGEAIGGNCSGGKNSQEDTTCEVCGKVCRVGFTDWTLGVNGRRRHVDGHPYCGMWAKRNSGEA